MASLFGGAIFNEVTGNWETSYLVQGNGDILATSTATAPGEEALSTLMGDKAKSKLARRAIEHIAQAAGKIYVPICLCRETFSDDISFNDSEHNADDHRQVVMSGFWLEGDKFVTAAHFLDALDDITEWQMDDTVEFLNSLPTRPRVGTAPGFRVRVSGELKSYSEREYKPEGDKEPRVYNTYLASIDKAADIAVFRLLPSEPKRPKHLIRYTQLASTAATQPNSIHCALFSVYYPAMDRPLTTWTDPNPVRVQSAKMSGCETVFDFLTWERVENDKGNGDIHRVRRPGYKDVFFPDCRSVGIGYIVPESPMKQPTAKQLTITREHTIVGFYGCSGGMVGTFEDMVPDSNSTVPSVEAKIIGLYLGESGITNAFRAFTPETIDFLVQS